MAFNMVRPAASKSQPASVRPSINRETIWVICSPSKSKRVKFLLKPPPHPTVLVERGTMNRRKRTTDRHCRGGGNVCQSLSCRRSAAGGGRGCGGRGRGCGGQRWRAAAVEEEREHSVSHRASIMSKLVRCVVDSNPKWNEITLRREWRKEQNVTIVGLNKRMRYCDCRPFNYVRERAREPALFTHPRFYHSAGYCTLMPRTWFLSLIPLRPYRRLKDLVRCGL